MNKIAGIALKHVDDRKILGVDPGYRHIGWNVAHIKNQSAAITHHGTIVLPEEVMGKRAKDARQKYDRFLSPEAIFFLGKQINNIMDGVTDCVYERVFFGRNVQSIVGVIEICGLLKLLSANHHARVFQYTPQTIKKAVTGKGDANKDDIINMVKRLTGIQPDSDHCADSIGATIAHILHLKGEHLKGI